MARAIYFVLLASFFFGTSATNETAHLKQTHSWLTFEADLSNRSSNDSVGQLKCAGILCRVANISQVDCRRSNSLNSSNSTAEEWKCAPVPGSSRFKIASSEVKCETNNSSQDFNNTLANPCSLTFEVQRIGLNNASIVNRARDSYSNPTMSGPMSPWEIALLVSPFIGIIALIACICACNYHCFGSVFGPPGWYYDPYYGPYYYRSYRRYR